jgi:hypothetical protein
VRAHPTAADATRDELVTFLRADAASHDAERFDAIGRRFDDVERRFPRGVAPARGRLHLALTFWDGWIDARNNGWPGGPIARSAWSGLARAVAADLEANREIADARVLACFDIEANARINDRAQALALRLRGQ